MAELATIARPYAEALFKSAKAGSRRPGAEGQMEPLAAVAGDAAAAPVRRQPQGHRRRRSST
jgi:F-type H+-transporting ATPase subunit delta